MKDILKKTIWSENLMSIIFAIVGILMIANTDVVTKIIASIFGIIFIIIGVIKIVDYFVAKGNSDFYNYDFAYGIIAIVIGIITITCSNFIESMFRIMIGIWIIYSAILRLSLSLKLRNANINIWSVSLVLSILMLIGGLYVLLQNGALVLTMGIIILVYSILDLIENIIYLKNINELL